FGQMSPEGQQQILGWIAGGPDTEEFRRARREWTGQAPEEADVQRYARAWQRDRLAIVAQYLDTERGEQLRQLIQELGEARPLDASARVMSWVGPTSPLDADAMRRLSVAQLTDFLRGWRAPQGHFESTPEGLGRVLTGVVAEDPVKFALQSMQLPGI